MLSVNCLTALRKGNIWNVFLTGTYVARLQNPTSSATYWYSLDSVSCERILHDAHWFHKLLKWERYCGKAARWHSEIWLACRANDRLTISITHLHQKLAKFLHTHPILPFPVYTPLPGSFQDQVAPKATWTLELHLQMYEFHGIREQHQTK